ncbi:MAG: hypothetical protein KF686_03515 [Ramlibacter sp.]|nr:hypothetical protein [Ramlibacter sp.]
MSKTWPGTNIRKSAGNAFTGQGYRSDVMEEVRRADSAARAGSASAATKRARGQAPMPRLQLPGSCSNTRSSK